MLTNSNRCQGMKIWRRFSRNWKRIWKNVKRYSRDSKETTSIWRIASESLIANLVSRPVSKVYTSWKGPLKTNLWLRKIWTSKWQMSNFWSATRSRYCKTTLKKRTRDTDNCCSGLNSRLKNWSTNNWTNTMKYWANSQSSSMLRTYWATSHKRLTARNSLPSSWWRQVIALWKRPRKRFKAFTKESSISAFKCMSSPHWTSRRKGAAW